jgi:Endosomal/lysosomal potassium channel TMEM175
MAKAATRGSRAGARLSKSVKAAGFIPTRRLEALTDIVFAFAMTLLVINIELPEGFDPKTNREFLSRACGPLRHVHRLSHYLFRPRQLLVRTREADHRT